MSKKLFHPGIVVHSRSVGGSRSALFFFLFGSLNRHSDLLAGLFDVLQNLASTCAGRLVSALKLFVFALEVLDFLFKIIY